MSQVIRSKSDLKSVIQNLEHSNSSIGLVPTMGALHQGHLALVKQSIKTYNATVATIFVNPAQFNNKEDLATYPKTEDTDIEKLTKVGCDYIFIPSVSEIYKIEPLITLNFGYLEQILEGKHRPEHFNGVGIVVMKLFGLIKPNGAFFGQKDLQQFSIISSMVRDFDMPVKLHMVSTIREKSGLAMSSRNKRLNNSQLGVASAIYAFLRKAREQLMKGEELPIVLKNTKSNFSQTEGIELEYFEIVDAETLRDIRVPNEGDRLALCVAANVGGVRLIDNIIIDI